MNRLCTGIAILLLWAGLLLWTGSTAARAGDWNGLSPTAREEVARAFGFAGPMREPVFAWRLDREPDLRRAFQRLYAPSPDLPAPPAVGDWRTLDDGARRAVAWAYGYAGPVRDGLFAAYLKQRPALEADHRARYLAFSPPVAPPPSYNAPWPAQSPEKRAKIAWAFGYDAALNGDLAAEKGFFAYLDSHPALRRGFQRRFGGQPPAVPPSAGDWRKLDDAERRAVAWTYGYNGPVRDGLFAAYLKDRPALEADHRVRYLSFSPPVPPPAPASRPARDWGAVSAAMREEIARIFGHGGPVRDGLFAWRLDQEPDLWAAFQWIYGPPPPAVPPSAGDWRRLDDAERRAVAWGYGYVGPVRDGLFAAYLKERPALEADHYARFLAFAPPPSADPALAAISGPWRDLSAAARRRVAFAFGYAGPLRGGVAPDPDFAAVLDRDADLRRAFQLLFGPPLPAAPPPTGAWGALSEAERHAVAMLYGYGGRLTDSGLVAYLKERPALEADWRARYPTDAQPPVQPVAAAAPIKPPVATKTPAAPPVPLPSAPPPPIVKAPPVSAKPAPVKPPAASGQFVIAGSFKMEANAAETARKIGRLGYRAEVVGWRDARGGDWRVVRVGPFATREEARAAAQRLTAAGTPASLGKP